MQQIFTLSCFFNVARKGLFFKVDNEEGEERNISKSAKQKGTVEEL